jgi:prepilin-type N-terminal cleavage/methylation domain-containing protein
MRCSTDLRFTARRGGFTLLEVMVVLIIVGLVAATLFEALSRLNDVRGRLGPFLGTSEREALENSWFRTAVNDIIPDKALAKNVFSGKANSFSGLTMAPLSGDPGGPSPFKWELVYDGMRDRTVLRFTGYDQKPQDVRDWRGSKADFAYLGADLTWHDSWPPGLQKVKQLPLAIRLWAADEGVAIVAAIRGEKEPPPDPKALFLGQ